MVSIIVDKLRSRNAPLDQLDYLATYHAAALQAFSVTYDKRFPHATVLGMGGSGIVLKLASSSPSERGQVDLPVGASSTVPKCLKYPHSCVGLPGDFSLTDVIDNEAARLGEINHPNIMPLEETVCVELEDKAIGSRDRRVPAYLMPYIPSNELCDYLAKPEATADELITLLSQAADAISYLHKRSLVHLDLKPANILVAVDAPGQLRALVSDFGFCKRIVIGSQGQTLVMGTDGYMDPDLLALMTRPTTSDKDRVRDPVPRKELRPQFDRYAFGATILDSLAAFLDTTNAQGTPRTIPTGLLRGLLFIALRCSGRHPAAMRGHDRYPKRAQLAPSGMFISEVADVFVYDSSEDLTDDLSRLASSRLAFLEPEVAEATGEAVCLPERMFVPLSTRAVSALDCVAVRRLATMTQLALCYHVYPGAAHTRKEHVLGAYRTTCRLLRQLVLDPTNPIGAMVLKGPQQRLAMVSALLHDMAHIPLMHDFEDSIPELDQRQLTSELLNGDWGGEVYIEDLRAALSAWDVSFDDLRLILGSPDNFPIRFKGELTKDSKERWESEWDRPDIQLVRSVIDGPVDADKIDYLQRDALHAGVRFGHGVDAERIETQMTTVIEAEGSGRQALKVRCRMGTWRKGQAASESLIGVRHTMYSQVYAHRTVRAARSMLNYVVWKWRVAPRYKGCEGDVIARDLFRFASSLQPSKQQGDLFELEPPDLLYAVLPKITDNLCYSDSRVIRWMAYLSGDAAAQAMAEALISRNLYRQVCTLGAHNVQKFIKNTFPKKNNVHQMSQLSARQWLSLTDYLDTQLQTFLTDGISAVVTSGDDLLPPLLLDISIPKTMRTQSELSIVRDELASDVSWRRVAKLDGIGVVPGAVVDRSPIYDAFGGNQDESLSPIVIRLFARGDLAPQLRPRVDGRAVASWLETFRAAPDK